MINSTNIPLMVIKGFYLTVQVKQGFGKDEQDIHSAWLGHAQSCHYLISQSGDRSDAMNIVMQIQDKRFTLYTYQTY